MASLLKRGTDSLPGHRRRTRLVETLGRGKTMSGPCALLHYEVSHSVEQPSGESHPGVEVAVAVAVAVATLSLILFVIFPFI